MFDVNYFAIIVAAVVSMVLGIVWYTPKVFGTKWMKYVGVSPDEARENEKLGMKRGVILGLISNLVIAFVLANLAQNLGKEGFVDALGLGFWMWLGFVATTSLSSVLWERKPWGYWILNGSYNLVAIIFMAWIVVAWR